MGSKFSERLKNLRQEKGMLQKDLAKLLNVSRSTIADWECRGHEPSYALLMEIAKIFGISIDYLLGMVDEI